MTDTRPETHEWAACPTPATHWACRKADRLADHVSAYFVDWFLGHHETDPTGEDWSRLRAALAAHPVPDQAWAEVEAALPEGWRPRITLQRGSTDAPLDSTWHATAEDVDDERAGIIGSGPTPPAALLALAARLQEAKP